MEGVRSIFDFELDDCVGAWCGGAKSSSGGEIAPPGFDVSASVRNADDFAACAAAVAATAPGDVDAEGRASEGNGEMLLSSSPSAPLDGFNCGDDVVGEDMPPDFALLDDGAFVRVFLLISFFVG